MSYDLIIIQSLLEVEIIYLQILFKAYKGKVISGLSKHHVLKRNSSTFFLPQNLMYTSILGGDILYKEFVKTKEFSV